MGMEGSEMNIEKLAVDYKNGNQKAFDQLYKKTLGLVRFAIYSYIQDAEIVNDLIQDTYMKVIERISSYSNNSFNSWIYTIAKNTALDYLKRKKEEYIEDPDILSSSSNNNPYLRYAISLLNEDEKDVFLMKVLCGYTTKKIAQILSLNIYMVNSLYYQAKEKLKRELEGFK